jgi:hypothetical protein
MRPVEAKRPYSDRAGYLREYMRGHMAHRASGYARSSGHPRMLLASGYDIGQKQLRDGSGVLMWPVRIRGSETPFSDGLREIDAAEKRRRDAPAPIKTPVPRAKIERVRHYCNRLGPLPRKFEQRRTG